MLNKKIYKQLLDIVSKENIFIDKEILEQSEKTNYKTNQKITAIICPESVEILRECFKIINDNKIPVYPISKGKNWGYGSKVPIRTNSIIIDLSKLNKIIDYNEELGFVTIEPGVTFQQLFTFLREKKSELIISITGSSKDSSLIGNTLDRGIGTGLYADRFSSVCNFEIMIPTGEIINTGFGRFGDTTVSKVYRWGVGPSLDGLFSQSNFGIVTKMTMWLMPAPENFQLLFYRVNDNTKLSKLIDTFRKLSLNGLIRPTITIYNDFRILSTLKQYPWDRCNPKIDSPEVVMKLLKEDVGISNVISNWNGEISIRSVNSEHGKIQFNLIKEAIEDLVLEITTVEISKNEILTTLKNHNQGVDDNNESNIVKKFLLGKYLGIPNDLAIRQTYWRKKNMIPTNLDPDKDNCGMIWICPVVPFTGEDINTAIKIIENTIKRYNLEPSISMQCMSERAINIIASISWDREILGEDENANDCYLEINNLLNNVGYFAYRDTTLGMKLKESNNDTSDVYNSIVRKIKDVFDPKNIIAPGRYIN